MSRPTGATLVSFTGGLNLRRNEFSLMPGESPDLLNIQIDERAGFSTRPGWERWNATDIVATPTGSNWDPKHGYIHPISDGNFGVYVANGTTVYVSSTAASFSSLAITAGASPHIADFASWGDTCYIACGYPNSTYYQTDLGTATALTPPTNATYNDDYTAPAGGYMPRAEFIEAHAGYIFTAHIREDFDGGGLANYPNRLRWSHPDEPEDWATNDYIDIKIGGGRITGLKSFRDHLLIFKENSVWALYGYGTESWQLIQVGTAVGATSPAAITKSPNAVFFYGLSKRSGIYIYDGSGEPEYISEPIRPLFDDLLLADQGNVYLGWTGRRLWVSVPWNDGAGGTYPGSVFVLDPSVGNGAWMLHRPALGKLNGIIEGADALIDSPIGLMHGDSGAACVIELDKLSNANDQILDDSSLSNFPVKYRTGWIYADKPEVRKSWRRPRFIVGTSATALDLNVSVLHNYDNTNIANSQILELVADGSAVWGSFNWGDGTQWGGLPTGSTIMRTLSGQGLGVASAVSLMFETNPDFLGKPWNISGIELKYRERMYTT